jgi:aminoglycoside phosphotransferase (APT) family kinase protein
LLLEDLKDLDVVHQGQGASLQQAQAAVSAITKLHAPDWGSTDVDVERRDAERRNASLRDAVLTGWDAFISLYDALLTAEFRSCRDQLAASVDAIAEHLRRSCPTTVHGDYKLDNMLFGAPGSGDEIVVLDWQAVGFGSAVEDLAGFLQTSLTIETRRVAEQDLLQLYQRRLEENGVETYPADQLQLDYKLALLTKIAGSIGGCANIVSGTWAGTDNRRDRRIREYSLMTFQRRIASVLDNDALSLMDPPY